MGLNDEYGAREIFPGLIAGTLWNFRELMSLKPDALVVLDRLPDIIWEDGFRGEILYYPIRAFDVLPAGILERMTGEIVALVRGGRRVAIFSRDDCGRLCYAAACALFRLGIPDPVNYLRKHYSAHALEDGFQRAQIEAFCHRHAAGARRCCAQRIVHIQIDSIEAFEQDEDVVREYRRISDALGEEARILLRFSGMLPSVRVMVQAATDEICDNSIGAFVEVVKQKGHFIDYINN